MTSRPDDDYRNKTIDYAAPLSAEDIDKQRHRRRIGRKWSTMGALQHEFLVARGLRPQHRLLDIGCGPLRAGRHFVGYLEPGHYYGIDINQSLLDAGYERELTPALRERLPRARLRATARFDCDFGVEFDYVIAQSVFTHVSLNHLRLCLVRVAGQLERHGRFYATYFEAPLWHRLDRSLNDGRRWTERNAYFYYRRDLRWAAREAGLTVRFLGPWGHPGGQRMAEFRHARTAPMRPHVLAERGARMLPPGAKRTVKRALRRINGRPVSGTTGRR